jgi:hypothetical protein
MAPDGLAVTSWASLARTPSLAEPFTHILAMDPSPVEAGVDLLAGAPGLGFAELAWGQAEAQFALAYWRHELGVRAELAGLWRALSAQGGLDGADLERALCGEGAHPRGGALCGRMLRVLAEVGLVEVDAEAREVLVVSTERTSLEGSAAFRAYAERLAAAERHLGGAVARAA